MARLITRPSSVSVVTISRRMPERLALQGGDNFGERRDEKGEVGRLASVTEASPGARWSQAGPKGERATPPPGQDPTRVESNTQEVIKGVRGGKSRVSSFLAPSCSPPGPSGAPFHGHEGLVGGVVVNLDVWGMDAAGERHNRCCKREEPPTFSFFTISFPQCCLKNGSLIPAPARGCGGQ